MAFSPTSLRQHDCDSAASGGLLMRVVYTIGYEGTDIDRFVETLLDAGVETLADVRAVTVSRKKGFSKSGLQARLASVGIRYIHFSKLGDPKPGREAARAGRVDEFVSIYTAQLARAEAQSELASLNKVVDAEATCLMCFERDPKVCHRSIVAEALRTDQTSVFHLYGDMPGRYRKYAAKLPRHSSCQGTTPAE